MKNCLILNRTKKGKPTTELKKSNTFLSLSNTPTLELSPSNSQTLKLQNSLPLQHGITADLSKTADS